MINVELAKRELLEAANKLQQKKKLSSEVGPGHYDPGRMENLEQYLGVYDAEKNTLIIRTESKGLRYEGRTPRLEKLSINDPVKLVREPGNIYNSNNFMILSQHDESLGNLSAELCNVIAPLYDLGYVIITEANVSYIENIKSRSRYAKQGVLFIEIKMIFRGI